MGPEVSLEVRALSVGLAAAWILTAVDGRPLFSRGPAPTLPLHSSRGQLSPNEHRLLVKGQLTIDLAVVTENVGVVVEVGHIGVVSEVRGQSLSLDEPGVMEGQHGWMLLRVVGVVVPGRDLTVVSCADLLKSKSING